MSQVLELRSTPRIAVECPTVFAGDQIVGEGTVVNLSEPGCAIKTGKPLKKGDYLELRVLMPELGPPLAIDLAKVRWAAGGHIGLQFISVRAEEQRRLARLFGKPL
ncbi:PilZ domain-containing protein [Candidatus Nitrospira bockiana]